MLRRRTPTGLTSNGQLCYVRCSDAGPLTGPKSNDQLCYVRCFDVGPLTGPKSNDQLCYVRCSDAGPQPDQKVTISYAMFDVPTDSVDFRCPPLANVDHSRMTCEARPTCEVDRLASSEQLSDLSTVAVWRGSALGSAGPSEWKAPWRAESFTNSSKLNG